MKSSKFCQLHSDVQENLRKAFCYFSSFLWRYNSYRSSKYAYNGIKQKDFFFYNTH